MRSYKWNKERFLKFLGKYTVYIGQLIGVAGIVCVNIPLLFLGLGMITAGCLIHEYNER